MAPAQTPRGPADKPKRSFLRRSLRRLVRLTLGLAALFLCWSAVAGVWFDIPFSVAAKTSLRHIWEIGAAAFVWVWDPTPGRAVALGPDPAEYPPLDEYVRLDEHLKQDCGGTPRLTVVAAENARIVRGRFPFRYQPADEPRLQELRTKYRLDDVVAPASSEFEAMVLLRGWARSQFRRRDYQPQTQRFDALTVLDRPRRNDEDRPKRSDEIDPCRFFPWLYCELLAAMGHQGRCVGTSHGQAEVWSNQFNKWVVMDAELNLHYERDGVPLGGVELYKLRGRLAQSGVRVVMTPQTSGDPVTTMVQMNRPVLLPDDVYSADCQPFTIVALRNDWMTNDYFLGHPARGECATLVYEEPDKPLPFDFHNARRQKSSRDEDFNWTLNQAEVLVRRDSPSHALRLAFRTVTPNFDHFEVTVDRPGEPVSSGPVFDWALHEGENSLSVRAVNKLGVKGGPSRVTLRAP